VGKALLSLANSGTAIVLTTHSAKILHVVKPTRVLVLNRGRIAAEGGMELVEEIEKVGYENFLKAR
jgi:Fe-S cluster assembly ATP-binding protein